MKYATRRRWVIFFLFVAILLLLKYLWSSKSSGTKGAPVNLEAVESETAPWKLSPLWVEDQKPHINPHK